MSIAFIAPLLVQGCSPGANEVAAHGDSNTIAAADSYCLDSNTLAARPRSADDRWKRYLHYDVCIGDPKEASLIFDQLIAEGDGRALYTLAIRQINEGNPKAKYTMERAAKAATNLLSKLFRTGDKRTDKAYGCRTQDLRVCWRLFES